MSNWAFALWPICKCLSFNVGVQLRCVYCQSWCACYVWQFSFCLLFLCASSWFICLLSFVIWLMFHLILSFPLFQKYTFPLWYLSWLLLRFFKNYCSIYNSLYIKVKNNKPRFPSMQRKQHFYVVLLLTSQHSGAYFDDTYSQS
jgi:hypothetical protein